MFTKNIKFKNFIRKKNPKTNKILRNIIKDKALLEKYPLLNSLTKKFQYSYKKKNIKSFKSYSKVNLIGMGGSIIGAESIYNFLKHKVNKKFFFYNNLQFKNIPKTNEKNINLVISKSGNTLETVSNFNLLLQKQKKNKNVILCEKKNNFLSLLAKKLKAEIFEHKNYIGGRYSVLSETGMLPAELMGLNEKKFKRLNYLIKNKKFINNLIGNVANTLNLVRNKKYLSILLNYDRSSENLFSWYQQLIAESLGKKSKGILPLVSTMPKDNHSLMQFYLDGPKKNFYTFFSVLAKNSNKINSKYLLKSHSYLRNKNLSKIISSQIVATQNIFKRKKIPFRSFEILKRNEQSLGEIFCFFILETILLGRALKVNPFDQPSVELIKKETKKILIRN